MGTSRRDLRTSGDLVMAPRVPHGLAAAVEGLTREVIRQRPEDIYVFAAQHFEELLKLRDEFGATTNLPGKSTNTAALREMNQSLKKRSGNKGGSGREGRGWSMNETARVLERHRSIFGDKGRKVSSEEVRALGNEKENKARRKDDDSERFRRRGSSERFVRRKIPPKDAQGQDNKAKSGPSANPKIISQIPNIAQSGGLLAKDIKSELRKNRNSSRDPRNIRERTEKKTSGRNERLDFGPGQSGTAKKPLRRSSRERSLDKLIDSENETDNQKQKTDSNGSSRSFAKMPRTLSMDRVRDFVVKKFRSSESWEELRSTNYVDRVQEVIDDAAPSILRQVKELSTRSALPGRRSRGYESVDESTSTSTRSDKSNQTDDVRSRSAISASRRSRRSSRRSKSKSKSKTSGADSLEGIETLASETEAPRNPAHLKIGTKNSANGFSAESDASEHPDPLRKVSNSSNISLPAVRPPSSKNQSRSVSRSDSDNLVLPPIPPEVSRSAKLREELILPSLQGAKEALKEAEAHEGGVLLRDTAEVEIDLPDPPNDEVFKDSLNVTPEIYASPRPDSLEPDGGEARNFEAEDNVDELESRLNEIGTENDGMKETLREIEETEKRIEKILTTQSQDQGSDAGKDAADSVKEKLAEIQEAEEKLIKILDPDETNAESRDAVAPDFQEDVSDVGIEQKLVDIEETEKRIEKIFDSKTREVLKGQTESGVNENPVEVEQAETEIEEKFNSEAQEIPKNVDDLGMKEGLMEIEETEKRIEKILHPETEDIQKAETNDGIKETLIEIEETEKRIEKILNPDPQGIGNDDNDDFVKEKLMEIQEAEKRLNNVFHLTPGGQENLAKHDNSAPKTPFIPEIPSEFVTTANEEETVEEEAQHPTSDQLPEQLASSENTNDERIEAKPREVESKLEQFSSGTPDSLGNSYVLTEGSPYEIPDSVTTVIIPERQLDTPSSEVLEILLEDDLVEGSEKREEDSEESGEMSLRNILDNFGEIVQPEVVVAGPPDADVDFLRNLKTPSDVVISRKDLGQIREEDDKDVAETNVVGVGNDAGTPTLDKIAESEEILELEEAPHTASAKSCDPEDEKSESGYDGASGGSGKPEGEPEEKLEEAEKLKDNESPDPEKPLEDKKTTSSEILEHEITSPTHTAVGSLQQNVTDSATTESTDEVKETTISDDGGNTAVESSVTSPSCGEDAGVRNSESSNEVKETTISDQPADENGKNLFSLVPQCHGSMPHVPELNLDSLQDITVSSFQLSDDATAEEDIDPGQPQSDNDATLTSGTEKEANKSQNREPVHEEVIFKEEIPVKEDPCEQVIAYVTEPDAENVEPKILELDITGIKGDQDISVEIAKDKSEEIISEKVDEKVPEEVSEKEHEDVDVKVDVKEPEEITKDVAEKIVDEDPEEVNREMHEKAAEEKGEKLRAQKPEELHEEIVKKVPGGDPEEVRLEAAEKVSEEKPEEVREELHKALAEEEPKTILEELAEDIPQKESEEVATNVAEKEPEEPVEDVARKVPEEATEQKPEVESEKEHGEIAEKVSEEKPEELVAENLSDEKPEEIIEDESKKPSELEQKNDPKEAAEVVSDQMRENESEDEPADDVDSKSLVSHMDTISLNDFKTLEALVGEEYAKEVIASEAMKVGKNVEPSNPSSGISSHPEVDATVSNTAEERSDDPLTSAKINDLEKSHDLHPPKAEVVTNDLDDDVNNGERMEYHIYVPEVTTSDDCSTTTESSTFNSAATKIQAGVRGFLTRRRLQSAQRRSSTLDSVPSIQDSLAADAPHLEPIEEVGLAQAATTIQSSYRGYKARQRLRREDAVQKTTMSVENAFSGNGLQHTGEFHDCLPLPPFQPDEKEDLGVSSSEEIKETDSNGVNCKTESETTKDEDSSAFEEEPGFGLVVKNYPLHHQGLNLVVVSGNESALQSQYLNFITSIEEVRNEDDSSLDRPHLVELVDGFSALKSNVGIESLPTDNPPTTDTLSSVDGSASLREPLAVPGTPSGLIIEELSKTDDGSIPADATSSGNEVKSETNLAEGFSEVPSDSLDLPGLSLEGQIEESSRQGPLEVGKTDKAVEETRTSMPDASLGTMSFSMNVDDMLGLGGESDPPAKVKPILEVTVTPRDLLKLTNRSQGSQVSADRVESPVTMMQIVPKSVEDKSDRSEEERDTEVAMKKEQPALAEAKKPLDDEEADDSEEKTERMSKTFSIEKNDG